MIDPKYIEEIIKVAQQGNYQSKLNGFYLTEDGRKTSEEKYSYVVQSCFLDPNFWQAIGKVKGWKDYGYMDDLQRHRFIIGWKDNMHTFLDKIIEKDLDHAIEWLYKLIKE